MLQQSFLLSERALRRGVKAEYRCRLGRAREFSCERKRAGEYFNKRKRGEMGMRESHAWHQSQKKVITIVQNAVVGQPLRKRETIRHAYVNTIDQSPLFSYFCY